MLRRFLFGVLLLLAPSPASAAVNPIVAENNRAGTAAWLEKAAAPGEIYASEISIRAGEPLHFHVSTQSSVRYRVELFRIGWYGGAGGRRVACSPSCDTDRPGVLQQQPGPPPTDPYAPAVRARWPVTDTIATSRSWPSGYYLARVVVASGGVVAPGGHTWVIVRRPGRLRPAPILVQVPVNTWQAYNAWGGVSLYDGTHPRVYRVSFDRPFAAGSPGPELSELPLVHFLEQQGYDVQYQTDVDTDAHPASLRRHKLVIVAGHDEYWTRGIRDAFESALAAGTNLAFLGANIGFWQMRYEQEDGTIEIVEYRSETADPSSDPATKTTRFRRLDPPRPECRLLGVQYAGGIGGTSGGTSDLRVGDSTSPWFAGTGLFPGSVLPHAVGGEWDTFDPTCGAPDGTAVLFHGDGPPAADAVTYTAPSGARVFSAGTLLFSRGLDDLGGVADPRQQRFMRNLLNDLSTDRTHAAGRTR